MAALIRSLLMFAATVLFALPAGATETPSTLAVHGSAELSFPADQANLSVGVVTTAGTAEAALAANNSRLAGVKQAVLASGLDAGALQTGQFEIRPDWTPRPRDAGPDWQPAIAGYTVVNSLDLTIDDLPKVGTVIAASVKAGANRIDSLRYGLADLRSSRAKAITAATHNAYDEARVTAAAANVQLGPVVSLQLEPAVETAPVRMLRMSAEAGPPPLSPGAVTVHAAVNVVFAIVSPK